MNEKENLPKMSGRIIEENGDWVWSDEAVEEAKKAQKSINFHIEEIIRIQEEWANRFDEKKHHIGITSVAFCGPTTAEVVNGRAMSIRDRFAACFDNDESHLFEIIRSAVAERTMKDVFSEKIANPIKKMLDTIAEQKEKDTEED